MSITYLTVVLNSYMGVFPNMTILTTTIDRAFHKGIAANGHITLVGDSQRLSILKICSLGSFIVSTIALPRITTTTHVITSRPLSISCSWICVSIYVRSNTLTSTKHVAMIVRTGGCSHHHVVRSDFRITSHNNSTCSAALQVIWFTYLYSMECSKRLRCCNEESSHRSLFATTIHATFHLGIALNSYNGVSTQQTRIAVSGNALTGTEYITLDNGFARSRLSSYRYHRILFYSAYLTATIDVAFHRAVFDDNTCTAISLGWICAFVDFSNHSFVAGEIISFTLTTAKNTTSYSGCVAGRGRLGLNS